MADVEKLFALLDQDDAAALTSALAGIRADVPILNENGESLVLYGMYRGKAKCVGMLLARGGASLHEAAAAGDVSRLDSCLRAAPWAIGTLSGDGWTALHLAAFLGRDDAVELLLGNAANARQWGRALDANLAIHAACAGRCLGKTAFARLIAATGDPDIPQKAGFTALMIAAANGFADAVEALLSAGADRGRKTADGKTAADFARERGHDAVAQRLA